MIELYNIYPCFSLKCLHFFLIYKEKYHKIRFRKNESFRYLDNDEIQIWKKGTKYIKPSKAIVVALSL